MSKVIDLFRSLLPSRAKASPSGWTSFNAPCCHHRGHSADTRKRAGVRFDNGIVYNCFNCKFTTGWQPGSPIGEKLKSLCRWLNASDDVIKEMIFEAIKTEAPDYQIQNYEPKIDFTEKSLPEGALPIKDWLEIKDTEIETKLSSVLSYLIDRGFDPLDSNFFWSPTEGYDNRVIIPFYYQGKIVGNTARKITNGNPKYLSDQHPNFVFNMDAQFEERQYLIVTEGPFDALAVGGVAVLTNNISDLQSRIINSESKKVIVVPDQDISGLELIKRASELDYAVAFPNWELDIKDCADAVQRYGLLYTIVDIIETSTDSKIKIEMLKKQLEKKFKEHQ